MDLSSVRQEVEQTMAIPLDANPNHGLDNRAHEVVGSVIGHIQCNLDMQSVTFNPRNIVSERNYGEAKVGA